MKRRKEKPMKTLPELNEESVDMKKLSGKSKTILDRFIIHRDRCLHLAFLLGEDSANTFHARFKSDPGGECAKQEYERLISTAEN